MKKGFTLIEVIIYIALFSLLMGSAFVVTYQLIDGSSKLSEKNVIQEEGNFVMRKIGSAFNNAETFSIESATEISITSYGVPPTIINIKSETGKIYSNSTGTFLPLTTDNVDASLSFGSPMSNPLGIEITATINGIDFNITKYIRQ